MSPFAVYGAVFGLEILPFDAGRNKAATTCEVSQFKMFLTQCKLSKYLHKKRSSNPNVLSFSRVSQKSALVGSYT